MKRFTSETLVAVTAISFLMFQPAPAIDVAQLACTETCVAPDCTCLESSCETDPAASCACSASACAGKPLCYTARVVTGAEAAALGFSETSMVTVRTLCAQNLRPSAVLSRLDIDQDGVDDNSPDTDGDGLPDNWEGGGIEALSADGTQTDRVVFFPAPTAIVPGTPPTPIFTRLAVTTSALDPDTDGDGLSDFVEVFGLKFIDENSDGILQSSSNVRFGREWVEDESCGRLAAGSVIRELLDGDAAQSAEAQALLDAEAASAIPGDGFPGPGECPRDSSGFANAVGRVTSGQPESSFRLLYDFDGFVFTDPVNRDTDGDGVNDKDDNDPLINPRSFGVTDNIIVKFNVEGIDDFDQDGLGNGMDMGNDLRAEDFTAGGRDFREIDNPQNIFDLLELFRRDLVFTRNAANQEVPIADPVVPEAAIEDLLGADWDGNGLWRTTDVRTWSIVIDDDDAYPGIVEAAVNTTEPDPTLFVIDGTPIFTRQRFCRLAELFGGAPCAGDAASDVDYDTFGGRGIGLGWQDLLQPTGTPTNFLPDPRVWAVLYSWRMPGFDIDGDGFIGVPNLSNTKTIVQQAAGTRNESVFTVAFVPGNGPDGLTLSSQTTARDTDDPEAADAVQLDDFIDVPAENTGNTGNGGLDGRISVDGSLNVCGTAGLISMGTIFVGLCSLRLRRRACAIR